MPKGRHTFLGAAARVVASNCSDCSKRSVLTCTKCGRCYLCHGKIERNAKQMMLSV